MARFLEDVATTPPGETPRARFLEEAPKAPGAAVGARFLEEVAPQAAGARFAEDVAPGESPEGLSIQRQIAAGAARIVPPIVGGILGGLPGAALGGAGGEYLGEAIEGADTSPVRIGLAAATGLIPGVKFAGGALKTAAVRGLEGAGISGASEIARQKLEGEDLNLGQAGTTALIGGAVGAPLGALEGGARTIASAVERARGGAPPPDVSFEPPPPAGEGIPMGPLPPRQKTSQIGVDAEDPQTPLFGQGTGEPGIRIEPRVGEKPDGTKVPLGPPVPPGFPGARLSSDKPSTLTAESVRLNPLQAARRQAAEDDVTKVLDALAVDHAEAVDFARRGRVSDAYLTARGKDLADELARRITNDPEEIARIRNRQQALNDEQTISLLDVNQRFAERTMLLADAAARHPPGSPERLAEFEKMAESMGLAARTLEEAQGEAGLHSAQLQQQAAGAAAEQGRSLRAHRVFLESLGPRMQIERAARKIGKNAPRMRLAPAAMDEIIQRVRTFRPEQVPELNRYLATITPATFGDKAFELYINGLLSGVPGKVADTISNGLMTLRRPVETTLGAGVDVIRSGLTGKPREVFAGEALADLAGHYYGFRQGVRGMLRTLATEMPTSGEQRVLEPGSKKFAIGGKLGRFVRLPGTVTMAIDELFKPITAQGFLYSRAYRIARQEGLEGNALAQRMGQIIDAPEKIPGLLDDVHREALYRTWQTPLGEGALGKIAKKGFELRNAPVFEGTRAEIKPLQWIIPFYRTAWNLSRQGFTDAFSGPTFIAKAVTGNLPKGGAALSEYAGRTAVGMAVALGALTLAHEGLITGAGPLDPRERDALRKTGWQPNSLKIGNQYVQYSRIDPAGLTAGIAADMGEAARQGMLEKEDALYNAGLQVANAVGVNLLNKTYLKGISDLFEVVNDPKRYAGQYVAQQAGGLVPYSVLGTQTSRAIDPTVRSARITKDIPGGRVGAELSSRFGALPTLAGQESQAQKVLPIRDIWGGAVVRPGGFMERFASPFRRSEVYDDPASVAVRELGYAPGSPSRSLKFRGKKLEFTDEQYDRYVEQSGQEARRRVTRLVTAPRFQNLMASEPGREKAREMIAESFRDAREMARRRIRGAVISRALHPVAEAAE